MHSRVRTKNGLILCKRLEDHGYDLHVIKAWRATEGDAGRACALDDFFAAHGLCFDCQSQGVQMIGWSDPVTALDLEGCAALKLDKLPLYETCSTCHGSGKADRAQWK